MPGGFEVSLHEAVGGSAFFVDLVDRFYDRVEADADLLALYPDQGDLAGARHRLATFLIQYWGGPTTYAEERGHPRLRQRHFPFDIGTADRDRWLAAMRGAVDEMAPAPSVREALLAYFDMGAEAVRIRD